MRYGPSAQAGQAVKDHGYRIGDQSDGRWAADPWRPGDLLVRPAARRTRAGACTAAASRPTWLPTGLKVVASRPQGIAEAGPAPVALLFETSEAVDDIRCELADGTAIVLQAKRACGADEQLQRTVSQWVRHLPDLKTGDRMGLATANPRGPVRALGTALARRQRPLPGPFSTSEREALDAVRARFPPGPRGQLASGSWTPHW